MRQDLCGGLVVWSVPEEVRIWYDIFKWKSPTIIFASNLNGQYLEGGRFEPKMSGRGITWMSWRGYDYGYKFVQMMIRPKCSNNLRRQGMQNALNAHWIPHRKNRREVTLFLDKHYQHIGAFIYNLIITVSRWFVCCIISWFFFNAALLHAHVNKLFSSFANSLCFSSRFSSGTRVALSSQVEFQLRSSNGRACDAPAIKFKQRNRRPGESLQRERASGNERYRGERSEHIDKNIFAGVWRHRWELHGGLWKWVTATKTRSPDKGRTTIADADHTCHQFHWWWWEESADPQKKCQTVRLPGREGETCEKLRLCCLDSLLWHSGTDLLETGSSLIAVHCDPLRWPPAQMIHSTQSLDSSRRIVA